MVMAVPEVEREAGSAQWWAVAPLLLQPTGDKVRLLSPKAGKRIVVPGDVAQLMLAAQRGISKTVADTALGWTGKRYAEVTRMLAGYGYLVDHVDGGEAPPPWDDWGAIAWAYHNDLTRPSAFGVADARVDLRDVQRRPSSFRDFGDRPVLLLPRLSSRADARFVDVLERRRTHRHFASEPISVEDFADLLRYTFGPLRFADAGALGVMQLRAAASGGARHETEAFVYVFDVENIEPGLYLYDALRHGLVEVRSGLLRDEFDHLIFDQGTSDDAAFGVMTVAQSERMSWKYPNPSAYRVLWQNVGCLAQVFSMMCTALDLGSSMTGGIRADEARTALGLGSDSEIVTFAMCCGRPRVRADGLPESVAVPRVPFRP
jgi:SagB-type dehydrogenase family enzyme